MYAVRRLHVKQYDYESPDERYTVQIARGGQPVSGIQSDRISVIEEEVMYWRKANHIHGWFVENVQFGNDDCHPYYVSDEKLRELLDTCEKVIKASVLHENDEEIWTFKENAEGYPVVTQRDPCKVIGNPTIAKQLLPRRDGFFFGSQEYDESYLKAVVETRDWAERMLADRKAGDLRDMYYSSSW